jgi:sterol desaturase/sphingolipid hydroxylase (fatty acid hydroxylase superfamily)
LFDLHHLLLSIGRQCVWLALLLVVFLPLERLFAVHRNRFFRKALSQDLGYYFISGLVPPLLLAVPLSLVAVAAYRTVPWHVQVAVAAWPLWQRILVGFIVGEMGFYWGHRWMHEIPFLWHFHAIHHSAEHVYFLTSARAHPLDSVFIRLCGMIPVVILGVGSPLTGGVVAALIVIVATLWGFFIHANLRWRLGPLEWLVATPSFHRWHHTRSELRDRNYASMLPWVDMIFGTYHNPRRQRPPAYGIEGTLPRSLTGQLLYPLLPAPAQIGAPQPFAGDGQRVSE